MGGLGSGTRRGQKKVKPIVEGHLNLDILSLKKQGLLKPGATFKISYSKNNSDILSLSVVAGPDSLSLEYSYHQAAKRQEIQLTRSSCHYGGKRTWLLCGKCESKGNTLYLGSDGHWACRQCLGLAYRVQSLNPHERHAHMAEKIKRKMLKTTSENPALVSERPFRMRRKTHMNVVGQILEHQQLSQELFMDWFDGVLKKADTRWSSFCRNNR